MYRVYANTKGIIEAWKARVQPTRGRGGWDESKWTGYLRLNTSEVCAGDWRVEAL